MDARIDQQFARFQQTHDPRLLADVFDATAPELWRVAAHLCRDRHDAEDAVQSAFLAAIAAKESWDAQRPVLPWLLGLLANRVREQRRAAARVVDAARLGERAGERDPAAVAQDREFGGAFVRALAAVDEPFRSVVERHLVHGQAAVDIAQELGVPAATVRTRLHRGLEQLRQKLPVGVVAMGVVPAVMPREVLAAMREQVVAAVPGGGVVAGAVAVGGWGALLMTKAALAVCVVLLVVVVGVAAWQLGGFRNSVVLDGPAVSTVAAQNTIERSKDLLAARDVPGASPMSGRDREPAPLASLGVGTLRVLVRSADTMQPIAKVQVQAFHEEEGATAAESPPVDAADRPTSAAGRTDEQGRVVLRLVAGRARVCVGNSLPVPSHAVVVADAETEHVHPIEAHFVADVLVVDAQGRPVAGASIYGVKNDDGYTHEPELLGRTDEEGRWRSPRTEPFLVVHAVADGQAASVAKALRHEERVELQLGGAAVPVQGSVVDADQRPLASMLVAFVPWRAPSAPDRPLVVRTDALGRFACSWLAAGRHHVLVATDSESRGAFLLTEAEVDAARPQPLQLRMPRGASVQVLLLQQDGRPAAHAGISLRIGRAAPACLRAWTHRGGQADANGALAIDGLMPGSYDLHASMPHEVHQRSIELQDGERVEVRHTFAAAVVLALEVVDEHGGPREGILVRRLRQSRDAESRRTGRDGTVHFDGVAAGEHDVTVGGFEGGVPWSRHTVSTSMPARIVVPTSMGTTRVIGCVMATTGMRKEGLKVCLVRRRTGDPFHQDIEYSDCAAATGRFVFERVPPGNYSVLVVDPMGEGTLGIRDAITVPETGTVDLGSITLGWGRGVITPRGSRKVETPFVAVAAADDEPFACSTSQEREGDSVLLPKLPAASLRAMFWGANVQPTVASLAVRIGATTEVLVDVVPGVRTVFSLPSLPAVLTYLMQDGTRLREAVFRSKDHVRGLAPGNHRIEFLSVGGERLAADFTVGTEPGAPIELLPVRAPR